jgi:hypothetical protein
MFCLCALCILPKELVDWRVQIQQEHALANKNASIQGGMAGASRILILLLSCDSGVTYPEGATSQFLKK